MPLSSINLPKGRASPGAIAIAQPSDTGALVSHRFPTYVFNSDVALPEFYQYRISNKQLIYDLGIISPGGAGRNRVLNKKDFLKLSLALPGLKEQQKIAECLGSLDGLIAAEGRNLAALHDHKRGLMQQLFPQPGQTQPRLRFPEFRDQGVWVEKRIGEILTLEYGRSLPEKDRRSGEYPVVGSNGIIGYHDEAVVDGPAIIVGRKGSAGQVNWIESDCYPIDTTFFVSNLNHDLCSIAFLWRLLERSNLETLGDAGAVPGLNRNEVYQVNTYHPSRDEQKRIADCLTALDTLIIAQAAKIETLKQHKRGLMQQLFPAPEEV